MIVNNRNLIQQKIKKKPISYNSSYHQSRTFASSSAVKRRVILPVILYGCITWSRTIGDEIRLKVFENRMLMSIFGPDSDELTGSWGKPHNVNFVSCTLSPAYLE